MKTIEATIPERPAGRPTQGMNLRRAIWRGTDYWARSTGPLLLLDPGPAA